MYIKREDAMKVIYKLDLCLTNSEYFAHDDLMRSIPSADVAEVRHGRWELGNVEPGYFTPGGNRPWACSECGRIVSWHLEKPTEEYCHCGCKMDKEE